MRPRYSFLALVSPWRARAYPKPPVWVLYLLIVGDMSDDSLEPPKKVTSKSYLYRIYDSTPFLERLEMGIFTSERKNMKIELIMSLEIPLDKINALRYEVPNSDIIFSGLEALEEYFIQHAKSMSRKVGYAVNTEIQFDGNKNSLGYGTTGFVGEKDVDWIPF